MLIISQETEDIWFNLTLLREFVKFTITGRIRLLYLIEKR
jgi:hypothetical protein